jgi:Zn-dependent protease with chaperone function
MAAQGDSSPGGDGPGAPERPAPGPPGGGWEVPHVQRAPDAPRHTAPGTFSAPEQAAASGPAAPGGALGRPAARPHPRRGPDLATVATMVASLPLIMLSFFVVLLALFVVDVCLGSIDLPLGLVVLGWLASGALVFLPAAEPHLARRLLGLRRPTDAEAVLVQAAWLDVAPAAGVDPATYSLWIDDRPGVNACVPGGRFLALPRSIIELSPRQRAAVTAHELAHHLRGHASARLLLQWYAAPARAMLRTLGALLRTGGRGNPVLAPLGCVIGLVFLVLAGLGVWAVATMPRLRLTLLVLPFLPFLGRWAEKRCDRLAADAGYGPDLLAVLARHQESGQAGRGEGGALSARPSVAARADALRRHLAGDR